MPNVLEAEFRIVTPMFLGDADQGTGDGIRPPAVKGALRFWWRAINWGIFREKAADDSVALQALHDEEARLFGLAGDENGCGGQGCFLIRTTHSTLTCTAKNAVHETLRTKPAARYLGYGLMEAFASHVKGTEAGQLTRSCINEGQNFTVRLAFRGRIEPSVQDALVAWGLLGGIGSRWRHGFGSIALQCLRMKESPCWTAPESRDQYQNTISEILDKARPLDITPPYTAVSRNTRIDILVDQESSAFDALDNFGSKLLMYRSWGKDGKVLSQDSERNFPEDHNWSKGKRPDEFHPRRMVFGLPHNYGKGSSMQVKPERHARRASPLLFHVHPIGQHFIGVSSLLPARFLPEGEGIDAGGTIVTSNPDWMVLTGFLDGACQPHGHPQRFPGKTTIQGECS